MISAIGEQVENSPGTYKLNDTVYKTGLSAAEGRSMLSSIGITEISTTKDGKLSYVQRTPMNKNNTFVSTRDYRGSTIAKYNVGIGGTNPTAPSSWKSDGHGGGTLYFASQRAATEYMMTHGEHDMANNIASMNVGDKVERSTQTLINNGNSGFQIRYNGKSLSNEGVRMSNDSHGNLLISTQDGSIRDPFRVDRHKAQEVKPMQVELVNQESLNDGQPHADAQDHLNEQQPEPTNQPKADLNEPIGDETSLDEAANNHPQQ